MFKIDLGVAQESVLDLEWFKIIQIWLDQDRLHHHKRMLQPLTTHFKHFCSIRCNKTVAWKPQIQFQLMLQTKWNCNALHEKYCPPSEIRRMSWFRVRQKNLLHYIPNLSETGPSYFCWRILICWCWPHCWADLGKRWLMRRRFQYILM